MNTKLVSIAIGLSALTGLVIWSQVQPVPVAQEAPTLDATGIEEGKLCREADPQYSHKDFSDEKVSIPNDTIVCNSNFYQQNKPGSHIFPEDMVGVTFISSNLDNVFVPEGNAVIDSTRRKIKTNPDDKQDWIVDDSGTFLNPLNQ